MLLENTPVLAGDTSGATNANAGLLSHQRHLIQHGNDLYWVLLKVDGNKPGILRSTDGGVTWAVQDAAFALPDSFRMYPDSLGDTIYVALELIDASWVVARFDMLTNAYTSLSAAQPQESGGVFYYAANAAGMAASNGDFHLLVNNRVPGFDDVGSLGYLVESAGAWGAFIELDPGYCGTQPGLDSQHHGFRDSAGDLHWLYERWTGNVGLPHSVHGGVGDPFPWDLRHVKEGGAPETLQSVAAAGDESFNVFDVLVQGGSVYAANWRNATYLSSWVGTPDTAPSWTAVDIDTWSGPSFASFVHDAEADVLYVFYFNAIDGALWRATLASGVWGEQAVVYDPAVNPVPGGDEGSDIETVNAVLVAGIFGVGGMDRVGGQQRAVFFYGNGSAGGVVLNYCF